MTDTDFPVPLWDGDTIVDHAYIDRNDLPLVMWYRWRRMKIGYAAAGKDNVYMHRLILGLQPGSDDEVDHINRDKLDNRRANLRVVAHSVNCQNVGSRRGASSKIRGVCWNDKRKMWFAYAQIDGMRLTSWHPTEAQAAEGVEELRERLRQGEGHLRAHLRERAA